MLIRKSSLVGKKAGEIHIERVDFRHFVVESILPYTEEDQEGHKTWDLPTNICDDELMEVAIEVQYRSDGYRGSEREIEGWFNELQRFQNH